MLLKRNTGSYSAWKTSLDFKILFTLTLNISSIAMFNGRLKITVIEAKGLQLTNFMTRHQMAAVTMEPYVAIDVDEISFERTSAKSKTHEPTWNETFTTDLLRNAEEVGFTVFHDATIPPDDFIANCKISLSELIEKEEQPVHQFWVRSF